MDETYIPRQDFVGTLTSGADSLIRVYAFSMLQRNPVCEWKNRVEVRDAIFDILDIDEIQEFIGETPVIAGVFFPHISLLVKMDHLVPKEAFVEKGKIVATINEDKSRVAGCSVEFMVKAYEIGLLSKHRENLSEYLRSPLANFSEPWTAPTLLDVSVAGKEIIWKDEVQTFHKERRGLSA
jgi:hypothetical protein